MATVQSVPDAQRWDLAEPEDLFSAVRELLAMGYRSLLSCWHNINPETGEANGSVEWSLEINSDLNNATPPISAKLGDSLLLVAGTLIKITPEVEDAL
jgi:hypothetical protein